MTAVMRRAEAVRPVNAQRVSPVDAPAAGKKQSCIRPRTCVDHDQKLHETIVDVAWCCGLNNKDVLVSYRLAHCDAGLLVGVVQTHGLCDLYAQPAPFLWVRLCARLSSTRARRVTTDRFATSWASSGWEFPLSNLISFDMVDMVKEVQDIDSLERNVYPDVVAQA